MLIICPECELQVSDKAINCPHCGYPMKSKSKYKRSTKKKRLPNGFGQITEIKGRNLRNPFRASVTIGKKENGRPITKILKPQGYFRTYNDAYTALVEYNKNPYDLDSDITVNELYHEWSKTHFETLESISSARNIESAWKYCSDVYNMRVKDLRGRHIKGCMENGTIECKGKIHYPTANIKSNIKSIFNQMLDYAVEYEIVERNFARTFNISDEIIKEVRHVKKEHITFTEDEMTILWNHLNDSKYVQIILFQCYSGWRPQELGQLKLSNIDLDNDIMIGGMKTTAGTNRIVPIHAKIKEIVKTLYSEALELGSEYLINCTDAKNHQTSYKLTYEKYMHRYKKIIKSLKLNPEHRPHDPRKHFITIAKKYNVDEYAIKYIVGHAINDITEKVYTERQVDWLKSEIGKIK